MANGNDVQCAAPSCPVAAEAGGHSVGIAVQPPGEAWVGCVGWDGPR